MKPFDSVDVLLNVDLEVQDGEFITVLGPSGSGKTTIFRMNLVNGERPLPIQLWGMMPAGLTSEINALVTLIILLSTDMFLGLGCALAREDMMRGLPARGEAA